MANYFTDTWNKLSKLFTSKKKPDQAPAVPVRQSLSGLYHSSLDFERQGIGRKGIGSFVITENAQGERVYSPADPWTELKDGAGLGSKEQMLKDMLAHEANLPGGGEKNININIDDSIGGDKPKITDENRKEFSVLLQAVKEGKYSSPVYGAPDIKFTVSKGEKGENIYIPNRPLDKMDTFEKTALVQSIAAYHAKTGAKQDFVINMSYSSKEQEAALKQSDLRLIEHQKEAIKAKAEPQILKRYDGKNWAFTVAEDPEGRRIYTSVNDWKTLTKTDQENMLRAIHAHDQPRQVNMWGRLDPIVIVSKDPEVQAKKGEKVQATLTSMAERSELEDYQSRKRSQEEAAKPAPLIVDAAGPKMTQYTHIPTVADYRAAQPEKPPSQLAANSLLIKPAPILPVSTPPLKPAVSAEPANTNTTKVTTKPK